MKSKSFIFVFLLFSNFSYSSIGDYLPKDPGPTSTNFGETGLIDMPTARLMQEGSLKIGFSNFSPYQVTSINATPFSWLEAGFRYTEIKNQLYGPKAYSGNQSLKDKGFDIKIRLLKESYRVPEVSIGLRDIAGTGLFSSEYLVFSKQINNLDLSLGLGWGFLAGTGSLDNPAGDLHDSFYERGASLRGELGGGFNIKDWFSGPRASMFGGFEYFFPRYGFRLKMEYDTSKHGNPDTGLVPIEIKSRINYGLSYPIGDWGELNLGYQRGNQLLLSARLSSNFLKRGLVPKFDSPRAITLSEQQKRRVEKDDEFLNRVLLRNFSDSKIYLQRVNKTDDTIEVSVNQARFRNYALATGRAARIVESIAPEQIEVIEIYHMNPNNTEVAAVRLDRKEFKRAINGKSSPQEINLYSQMFSPEKDHFKQGSFIPEVILPDFSWKITPAVKSHIGGPEAFFLGQLWLKIDATVLIRRGLTLSTSLGIDIYNTFNQLNNPSASELPHVRSDIQSYLEEGKNNLARLKLDYIWSPAKNWFARIDVGLIEEMFGGIGGEILYRPFNARYGLGIVAHRVKQRDFDQRFTFRDYKVNTGHLEFFYDFPNGVSTTVMAGQYLAGDRGLTLDFSRRFKTGFRLGAFATKTNVSSQEFGEGSFDKGFYFQIPVDLFTTRYRTGNIVFGLHPLTKDGGALLYGHNALWGIVGNTARYEFERDWENILD